MEATQWYKLDILGFETHTDQVGQQLPDDLIEAVLAPQYFLEFVDSHDQLVDTQGANKQCVLFRRGLVARPTPFKASRDRINDEYGTVSLCSARNHVCNEVTMPWRIQYSKATVGRLEEPSRHLDGHTALALFIGFIHDVRKFKARLVVDVTLLRVLAQGLLGNMAELKKKMACQR